MFFMNICCKRHFTDVETFLASMEDELQKHFDKECTFRKLHEIAQNYVEDAMERIGTLNELASSLGVTSAFGALRNGKCTCIILWRKLLCTCIYVMYNA